ncbi:MAG: allophanate hydrolase subunit 1 [Micromonosporaceae bacterium]|nr:allophanate hydrolase subunit 1 [Micromonosporaceae bacterium]
MRVRAVGGEALLLEVDDPPAWFTELSRRRDAGELVVVDIVPGARTVLLDGLADPAGVAEAVRGWRPAPSTDQDGPLIEIPVVFDGPDLDEVAQRWGTDPAGVADRLTQTAFRVAFCGFAPGFAYLTGLPASLAVPRRATPRTRVPAGSVGLADTYAGVYPTPSPGGWNLVGRTEMTLFDPASTPPALLTPGTRVRFVATAPAGRSTVDSMGDVASASGEEARCSPS